MTGPTWAIIISLVIAAASALFGLIQDTKATRASNNATSSTASTKMMELGVKNLVDQYRERNEELIDDVHECTNKCAELSDKVVHLERHVRELERAVARGTGMIAEKEAEIVRLQERLQKGKKS